MTAHPDPTRDRLTIDGPSGPPGPRVPRPLERAMQDLQDIGLSPSFAERFLSWWKRHGLRKAFVFALAVTLPLWRYVWIPSTVSAGLESFAESYGANLVVEDWSSDWWDIAVTGEHLTLQAPGAYSEQRLLRADAIELDWSLVGGFRNLWRRAASIFSGERPPEEPVHAIRVRQATLHVERLLSGRWNWQDAVSPERIDLDAAARFRFPAVDFDELRLAWVEHLPAASGGGLIEQKTASLFLDDVRLRFADLVIPEDVRENATRFTAEGRTGDGRFSARGELNLARWGTPPAAPLSPSSPYRAAATTSGSPDWSPTFSVALYLENVGAAAFARLVSDASLLASSGTMTGRINLEVGRDGIMLCEIDMQLQNVQYAANPRSSYVQARRTQVEQGVRDLVVNEHIARRCTAPWQEPKFRVAKALHAEITGEAVKDAPPVVQGAAAYDQLRFVKTDEAAIAGYSSDISAEIGKLIGGERGAAVARALTAADEQGGNPVTRGMRSMGRGLKRVFGGKRKP